jgi:hypothetical protein
MWKFSGATYLAKKATYWSRPENARYDLDMEGFGPGDKFPRRAVIRSKSSPNKRGPGLLIFKAASL